jgi:hypothetical protein
MDLGSLVVVFVLLLLTTVIGIWWSSQRFWHYSVAPTLGAESGYWTKTKLVLLASLWHLLVYGVTAVFCLPWAKGAAHGSGATSGEWQQAHFNHEFWLLVLSGLGGAVTLLVRGRQVAAFSWLAGCLLVLASFRGSRTYHLWASEQRPQVESSLSTERAFTSISAATPSPPSSSAGAASGSVAATPGPPYSPGAAGYLFMTDEWPC